MFWVLVAIYIAVAVTIGVSSVALFKEEKELPNPNQTTLTTLAKTAIWSPIWPVLAIGSVVSLMQEVLTALKDAREHLDNELEVS